MRVPDSGDLPSAVGEAVRNGAPRVLVAGGDGTLASACAALAGTATPLGILPCGTLNHFARDHGIPTELKAALDLALNGTPGSADVGYVNNRLFLNTSSVGAYVRFVFTRERLERMLGYHLASMLAAIRVLARLPRLTTRLEVEGAARLYETPFLFVGVGERSLTPPELGGRVKDGTRALHVIVPRGKGRAPFLSGGYFRLARGAEPDKTQIVFDRVFADQCQVSMRRHHTRVAVDGEITQLRTPLKYRIEKDAIRVVMGR